jgi:hypothetical protein
MLAEGRDAIAPIALSYRRKQDTEDFERVLNLIIEDRTK